MQSIGNTSKNDIFCCQDVSLSLGGREILNNVNLEVSPGEILGVVGPNGAGKTSLFEVLCGRYEAEAAKIFLNGLEISDFSFLNRSRIGLGRTYQSPVIPTDLNIEDTFRAARKAFRPFKRHHDAEWAARLAGLNVEWDTPAGQLDTFDRRKLLLACLILRKPKYILMDEPASGLINAEIDELDLIIRRLVDEYKIGIILIEHRLELLSAIADRVTVLDLGQVISEGSPEFVFNDPKVHQAYFEE